MRISKGEVRKLPLQEEELWHRPGTLHFLPEDMGEKRRMNFTVAL